MSDVVKLKLAEKPQVPDAKEQMLAAFDEKVKELRDWLSHTECGGFAILGYDKVTESDGRPTVHSWTNFFAVDPGDAFWLPDMAKTRIYQLAHEK